ncbi:MAG: hypothetical protein JHC33_13175 [Ignisphaera sp.]|jgi:hypothetical protein|nr:hypothetical protein [Ignisphaera sp.]
MQKITIRTPDILNLFFNRYNIKFDQVAVSILLNDIINLTVKHIYDPIVGITNDDIVSVIEKTDIVIYQGIMYEEFFTLILTLITIFGEELSNNNILNYQVYYISYATDYQLVLEVM